MNNPPSDSKLYLDSFNGLKSFKVPQSSTSMTIEPELPPFTAPSSEKHGEKSNDLASPTPLASELTILSLRTPACLLCKGQKYGFKAYFHNTKIFSQPPHELLSVVEKSYLLKNRLKSLLVTYAMREVGQDQLQQVEGEVATWAQHVQDLISEVVGSAIGFAFDLQQLEVVQNWTKEITTQLREKVWLRERMEMSNGRLNEVLQEFRKLWEGVWKGYLRDQGQIVHNGREASTLQTVCAPEL
jgi:hypothetical protein